VSIDAAAVSTSDVELGDDWAYGAGILHGGWLLETLAAPADRRDWWLERARRCHRILGSRDQPNFV